MLGLFEDFKVHGKIKSSYLSLLLVISIVLFYIYGFYFGFEIISFYGFPVFIFHILITLFAVNGYINYVCHANLFQKFFWLILGVIVYSISILYFLKS